MINFEKCSKPEIGLAWEWEIPWSQSWERHTSMPFICRKQRVSSWRPRKTPSCFWQGNWKVVILKYNQSILPDKGIFCRGKDIVRALLNLGKKQLPSQTCSSFPKSPREARKRCAGSSPGHGPMKRLSF